MSILQSAQSRSTVHSGIMFANEATIEFMPIGNREIDYTKVNRIKMSMQTYGITSGIVCIKTNLFNKDKSFSYYAADGQHRYEAARILNMLDKLPVYYVDKEFKSIESIVEFVSTLNTTQTPWKLVNYINAYASIGKENYIFLRNLMKDYNLNASIAGILCSNASNTVTSNMIKHGRFVVIDREKVLKIACYIQDFAGILGTTETKPISHLTISFFRWYNEKTYNHKKFCKWLSQHTEEFKILSVEGLISVFNSIKL